MEIELSILQRIGTATRNVQEAGTILATAKEALEETEEWEAYVTAKNNLKLCRLILDGAVAGTVRFAQMSMDAVMAEAVDRINAGEADSKGVTCTAVLQGTT